MVLTAICGIYLEGEKMNIAGIIRAEAYKRIAQKNDERIIQIMNKMKPNYREQQRQNMKKFVRSL